jgi:hypothetical protein
VKERNEMHTHATAKIYYYIETLRTSFITCTKSASAFAHRQNGFHKVKCMIMVFNACIPDQSKRSQKERAADEDRDFCELAPSPNPI